MHRRKLRKIEEVERAKRSKVVMTFDLVDRKLAAYTSSEVTPIWPPYVSSSYASSGHARPQARIAGAAWFLTSTKGKYHHLDQSLPTQPGGPG
ncbi:hypothetical protein NL676_028995 [Syzygium grande]|nr:hypothetical protein NL676_028995 [Syzygium grande]